MSDDLLERAGGVDRHARRNVARGERTCIQNILAPVSFLFDAVKLTSLSRIDIAHSPGRLIYDRKKRGKRTGAVTLLANPLLR